MTDRYKYDVCISFAGEDRHIAEDISNKLKESGLKVFFDDFEKFTFWGKDLYKYLFKIYYEESMFCITLFSDSYIKKAWTNHELRAAQTRMLEEKREYLLPIIIDKKAYPKEFSTIAYLEVTDINHDNIAETINHRLIEHLESKGWVESTKVFEEIMKEQNNFVFINQFIKSISKETDPNRALTMALLSLIYLVQDETSDSVKNYINFLLTAFKNVSDQFDNEHQFKFFDNENGAMLRFMVGSGKFQLLMKEEFWGKHFEELKRRFEEKE